VKSRKSSKNSGGAAAAIDRPNGHAAASAFPHAPLAAAAVEVAPRDVANARGGVSIPRDIAASDDARESSVAGAADSHAACPDREAYAEAAPPRPSSKAARSEEAFPGPTEIAALENGPSFVRAVASRVDLVGVSAHLVCSGDEKISKAELDRLRQLLFDDPAGVEEPPRIDFGDLAKPTGGQ